MTVQFTIFTSCQVSFHRPSGSGEEDFQRFLLFIAMAAILSCDLSHLYKLSFPLLRMLRMKFGFVWPSGSLKLWTATTDRTTEHDHRISSAFEPSAQVS